MYHKTTGVHQQKYFDETVTPAAQQAQYRSVMEEQLAGIESHIEFLGNALTTLEHRLAPVMRATPCKVDEASLPCADSPLGKKLEDFNSRMNGLQNHILYIIERLEV